MYTSGQEKILNLKYDTTASMTFLQAFALQKRQQLMISIANSQKPGQPKNELD